MPADRGGRGGRGDDIVGFPLSGGFDSALVAGLRIDKARQAMERGRPAQALVEAEELLDSHPDHVEAMLISARAAIELGDGPMALAALDAVARRQPDAPGLTVLNAAASFVVLEESRAWSLLDDHLAAHPDDREAWALCARMARCSDPPRPQDLARAAAVLGDDLARGLDPAALPDLLEDVLDALDEDRADWLLDAELRTWPHPGRELLLQARPTASPFAPFLLLQEPEPEDAPIEVHAFASAIDADTAIEALAEQLAALLDRQVAR